MAIKKYVDGAWEETTSLKRYVDGAWQNATSAKVYKDGAWEEKMARTLELSTENVSSGQSSYSWIGTSDALTAEITLWEGMTASWYVATARGNWKNPNIQGTAIFGPNPIATDQSEYYTHIIGNWIVQFKLNGESARSDVTLLDGGTYKNQSKVAEEINNTYEVECDEIRICLYVPLTLKYYGVLNASFEGLTIDGMKYTANGQIISA